VVSGQACRALHEQVRSKVVEAKLTPDAVVSPISCRHGLTLQQMFIWRRQARIALLGLATLMYTNHH
jgi:transposase-like protein